MGQQRLERRRPVRDHSVDPVIAVPEMTPTKPGPGQTLTESDYLPDPEAVKASEPPAAEEVTP